MHACCLKGIDWVNTSVLCVLNCLCYHEELLYLCGTFAQLQTPLTTSTLPGNLLTMLLITSMPPCWQWVDTHNNVCRHTVIHLPCNVFLCGALELLQAPWLCGCPVSTGVHQDWCLGVDLAAEDQDSCAAVPTEGRKECKYHQPRAKENCNSSSSSSNLSKEQIFVASSS